jgi:hypothetical protein
VQGKAFLLEKPVSGLAVEDRVEPFVFAVVAVCVTGFDGGVAALVGGMQFGKRVVGDARCGETGAHGLEFRHDLEHLE